MKIKIAKRKTKQDSAKATVKIPEVIAHSHREPAGLYHPVILFFGSVALIMICINIFGNFIFSNEVVYVSLSSQNEMTGILNTGTPAPNFILSNMTNGKVSNLNFRGSPLVILFWTTWNQLSVDQLDLIDKYLAKFPDTKLKVLAINSQEDKNLVSSFIKRGGYKIPIALDGNGGVTESYGAHNLPAIYFIDKGGVINSSSVGHLDEEGFIRKLDVILD
jgi:peroxiredoxin